MGHELIPYASRTGNLCAAAGVTSIDGTSATKYSKNLPLLNRTVIQQSLSLFEPEEN